MCLTILGAHAQKQVGQSCDNPEGELWTDITDLVNPNQYYFCLNGKTAVGTCLKGRGFAIENDINGCIPYSIWPCLNKNGGYPGKQNCGSSPKTPWAAVDPNQYYICVNPGTKEAAPSYALNCNGIYGSAGFFRDDSITTPGDEALGCLDWATWRQKTGCNSSN